jgi:hypothetical protein
LSGSVRFRYHTERRTGIRQLVRKTDLLLDGNP